jgi:hypothetical protein
MTSTSGESLRAAARQELALIILARAECAPGLRLNHAHLSLPKLLRVGYGFYPASPKGEVVVSLKELITTYL